MGPARPGLIKSKNVELWKLFNQLSRSDFVQDYLDAAVTSLSLEPQLGILIVSDAPPPVITYSLPSWLDYFHDDGRDF